MHRVLGVQRRTSVAVVAGLLVLTATLPLLGWIGVQAGYLHLNYPSQGRYPVRGLDVSNHQGSIDWGRVHRDGYVFAYIKATEGGDWVDPFFPELSTGARQAGMRVGAYHFFTFCRPGADQGDNFVRVVGRSRPGDLPPVVDLEFGGNCSRILTVAQLDQEFAAFAAVLRQAGFPRPVLYVTGNFAKRYLTAPEQRGSPLAGHRIWVRDIYDEPDGGCGAWAFWQYSNGGRVNGIRGRVDLNTYCGDEASFAREFG